MCWSVAAASGGLSVIGNILNYRSQAAQAEAQGRAAVTSMNRDFMNLEIQRQDAFDAAVQDIMNTRLQAAQLNSGVTAAVNEDLGNSNTGKLLERSVAGDEARNVAAIQDQYQQKSNEIDLNKETEAISTKNYINNIPQPSKSAFAVSTLSSVLGAYTQAKTAEFNAKSQGMDWNFRKGPVTRKQVNK